MHWQSRGRGVNSDSVNLCVAPDLLIVFPQHVAQGNRLRSEVYRHLWEVIIYKRYWAKIVQVARSSYLIQTVFLPAALDHLAFDYALDFAYPEVIGELAIRQYRGGGHLNGVVSREAPSKANVLKALNENIISYVVHK